MTSDRVARADELVERAAQKLQEFAERTAAKGGMQAKLAEELAEDAAFVRKLKPSLMLARARGEAPTDQPPGQDVVAPSGPQLGRRPTADTAKRGGGPNPFVVVAGALFLGIVLAKLVDWRGHAHPRD